MTDSGDSARLVAGAFETGPVAQLLFDARGVLTAANANSRTLLNITSSDIGRPVQALDVACRIPDLAGAVTAGEGRTIEEVQWPAGQIVRVLKIVCTPLPGPDGGSSGVRVDVLDMTEEAALRMDLGQTSRELAAAYQQLGATTEQLRSSNEQLLAAVDRLEATTEELRRVTAQPAAGSPPAAVPDVECARGFPDHPLPDGV